MAATITVATYISHTPGNEKRVRRTPAIAKMPTNTYNSIIPILI